MVLSTCRKKTTIKVKLLNPLLNEYVSNATIVLVEKKDGGLFSKGGCKEIATAVTDNNGECTFDEEKLKKNASYSYFCAVKESWGLQQSYPCEGIADRFLKKGGAQDWIVTDYGDGTVQLQYKNLFNPAQIGDSLYAIATRESFYDPIAGHDVGGGGVNNNSIQSFDPGQIYPPIIDATYPTKASGVFVIKTRKRKLGVVSTRVDTVKAYPNKTTIIEINW